MATIPQSPPGSWPRLMRAERAAAYVDEKSTRAFRRKVGTTYSLPITVPGRGEVWLKDDLDHDIGKLSGKIDAIEDAADVL